ncbi:MAG TPA: hypothetical protein VGE64_09765 [Xanthomonadaceae bacterium]
MNDASFVYAVLDTRDRFDDRALAERCRELTFAWSRWSYAGPILEDRDPHRLLARAAERGTRYCLVQACGHLVVERLRPKGAEAPELVDVLIRALGDEAWLVGRRLAEDTVHESCWLVDLERWQARGRPRLARIGDSQQLMSASSDGIADAPDDALRCSRDLEPHRPSHAQALRASPGSVDASTLERPLGEFVASLARTLDQSQRGVFIWNLESYDDIVVADPEPLASLACVAAGFKPDAILRRHGFTDTTELTFFDYSADALAFRRMLVEQWDGRDLSGFLWPRLQPDATHYWLSSTARGDAPAREELERLWARELDDWGGGEAFAAHWRATRGLRHRYVEVDLLGAPERAIGSPPPGPAAVWWSNAFSSVHALWHLRHAEREAAFARWIDAIAQRAPQAWLLGADANNSPVGGIRAIDYAQRLADWRGGIHEPLRIGDAAIRF